MSADGKKICVITGASGGIGRTIVKKFADNGFFTVLVDINEQQLASVIEQDGYSADTAAYRVLDISNESAVEETVADIAAEYGAVDVLVNAAGICGRYAKITDMDFGNMQKIYSVNVFGTFLMMRAALKIMVKQRSGAIVNFGSVSGVRLKQMGGHRHDRVRGERIRRIRYKGQLRVARLGGYGHDEKNARQLQTAWCDRGHKRPDRAARKAM